MVVDAAAYAQLVLENQGRTLSVQDAAVELGRLRAIPLPPRAGGRCEYGCKSLPCFR